MAKRKREQKLGTVATIQSYFMIAGSVTGLILFVVIPLGWIVSFMLVKYKGYGTMTDAWFDDNVFQIVVHRRLLGAGYPGLDALDRGETTVLPIWDAMA